MLNVFRQVLVMSYISIDEAILIYAEWLSNAEIIDTVKWAENKKLKNVKVSTNLKRKFLFES